MANRRRFGSYLVDSNDDRLTVRRTTMVRSLGGCVVSFALFGLSYGLLFGSAIMGRADTRAAYWSLGFAVAGVLTLFLPFAAGGLRRSALVLDRLKNEIRTQNRTLCPIEGIIQVVVSAQGAWTHSGLEAMADEKLTLYVENAVDRFQLVLVEGRTNGNRLADAIAEFLQVPVTFEQDDRAQSESSEA